MMLDLENARWRRTAMWTIIAVSLTVHVLALVLGHTIFSGWRWSHLPMHAAAEMAGSVIALMVAYFLVSLERRGEGGSHNGIIAAALVGMGVLDGLHALVQAGETFVWLHSTATLAGGVLFALVWLPERWRVKLGLWWPRAVLGLAAGFGLASILNQSWPPQMVLDGAFSRAAVVLNVGGGLLLFLAAARLLLTYRQTRNSDDLLFCLHCALFGAAAVMFEQSSLWDLPWWCWHLLRLLAYLVALWFIILSDQRAQRQLAEAEANVRRLNEGLEMRVAERTAQLQAANDELKRSNQALSEFAYVASHDLKEPLRVVTSYADLLNQNFTEKLGEKGERYLTHITGAAHRMRQLITDLLNYSRVGTGGKPPRPVNLGDAVDESLSNLEIVIRETGAKIVRPGPLPKVLADPGQVGQLLQNLIGNAIKFCESRPRVEIAARPVEGNDRLWEISVSDNGPGIAPEFHGQIFNIFRRLDNASEVEGTGIGLAICRRIVERHGGELQVDSDVGKGARFFFTLEAG